MKKFIYFLIFYICILSPSFGAIQYEITGLTDSANSYTPGVDTGNITDTQAFCVRMKLTGGDMGSPTDYKVTASSGNATGTTFRVYDSISTYVPYDIDWHDTGDQTGITTNLDSGVQSGTINNADSANPACSGGNDASFSLIMTEADIQPAITGTYTDTLTIIIGPV